MSGLTSLITAVNGKIARPLAQQQTQSLGAQAIPGVDSMTWSSSSVTDLPDEKTLRSLSVGQAKEKKDGFLQKGISTLGAWLGLDINGIPKAAALPVPVKVPTWLKMHRPSADELAAATLKLSPSDLAKGRELIEGLESGKGSIFHATNSDALAGLAKTGELLPMNRLAAAGVKRSTGEGTSMIAHANRDFVSLGEGREGLGSVLAYNDRMTKAPFSFGALSDHDLLNESRRLSELAADKGFSDFMPGIEKQLSSRLSQVRAEMEQRAENPRQAPPYPVMLGFKRDGLDLYPSSDVAGEMRVKDGISLKNNLESVMVNQKNMQEMTAYLERTLGPGHGVRMIATETIHQLKPDFHEVHYNYARSIGPRSGDHLESTVEAYKTGR